MSVKYFSLADQPLRRRNNPNQTKSDQISRHPGLMDAIAPKWPPPPGKHKEWEKENWNNHGKPGDHVFIL